MTVVQSVPLVVRVNSFNGPSNHLGNGYLNLLHLRSTFSLLHENGPNHLALPFFRLMSDMIPSVFFLVTPAARLPPCHTLSRKQRGWRSTRTGEGDTLR